MPKAPLKLKVESQSRKIDMRTIAMSEAETRMAMVMKGAKEGALKGIVDKMVDSIAGPITESILPKFEQMNPGAAILLEPAVKAALQFSFIMGLAELMTFAAPLAGKVSPGSNQADIQEKSRLLTIWMRKYAGERIGSQLVDAVLQVFPLIMDHFSQIDTSDVAMLLEDDTDDMFNSELNQEEIPEEIIS